MSLSLREELRVVLAPEQLLLVGIGREWTRRGLIRRVRQKRVISCEPGGDARWSGALGALQTELPALAGNTAAATVILSNHFMHYALVPWSGALMNAEEERVVARHFFRQLYGPAADSWQLRLSAGSFGKTRLASAVEDELLLSLRRVFAEADIPLRSIQPSLMAACNTCHDKLQDRNAWLVLYENGSLCIALLQHGDWCSVRTLRADTDWQHMLPLLLEREAYLIEQEVQTNEVLLWAPGFDHASLPQSTRWKFDALQPALKAGIEPDYEQCFAVAMGS
ncbi:MAG: hypothetical protein PHH36_05940 [Sideroxydans sp.]|nr:hypothetical protein [Sideroxydans sp.]